MVAYMAHTLTEPQRRLIQELLKVGRWNNESEIIRYGLHLVAKEVEAEQERSLEPYPSGVLARAYRRVSPRERNEAVGGVAVGVPARLASSNHHFTGSALYKPRRPHGECRRLLDAAGAT